MAATVVQTKDVVPTFVTGYDVYGDLMCQCCSLMKAELETILTEIKSASEIFNILKEEHKHDSVTKQERVLDNACDDKSEVRTSECGKRLQLENQLKDTLSELSSVKMITRILSEEIRTLKQTPVTERSVSDNSWATVESRSSHRKTTLQPSGAVHLTHDIPVTSRYTVLSNHHEAQKTNGWSSLSNFEQPARYYHKQGKGPQRTQTLRENQPCWPMNHQLHEPHLQESVKNEDWISPVPSAVSGVTNNNCKAKFTPNYNDKIGVIESKLTEAIIACNKNAASKKHKIIFMGDSHIRGHVSNLKSLLNNNFELYRIVKPGSTTSKLKETTEKEISQLSQDHLIVICSGPNEHEINEFSLTFQNTSNFIKASNHTNIILINIPFRYDLRNSTSVNEVSTLNRKLKKLVQVSPHTKFLETDNNRNLFTKHGLHLNKLGKQLVTCQIASLIHLVFEQKTFSPIILGWHNDIQDNTNITYDGIRNKLPSRNSSRNRKMPVTRPKDFLWQV
jgi:hypothetical protein